MFSDITIEKHMIHNWLFDEQKRGPLSNKSFDNDLSNVKISIFNTNCPSFGYIENEKGGQTSEMRNKNQKTKIESARYKIEFFFSVYTKKWSEKETKNVFQVRKDGQVGWLQL